jgi:hypothetical protein
VYLHRADAEAAGSNRHAVLNVHHRTYRRLVHEHREDVELLCEGCHARHHRVGRHASQAAA